MGETREIHIRVPVRITLVGEPGPETLDALRRQLTTAVAARLARAERMLPGYGTGRAGDAAGEPFDAGRAGHGGYAVPSYDAEGRPARIPVRGKAATKPWTVVRTVRTRMAADRFLAYVGGVLGHPLPLAVLYEAQAGVEFPLEVWLVRVDAPALPEELGEALVGRAIAGTARPGGRPGTPARTEPAWVMTGSSAALRALHALEPGGPVAASIPALQSGHVLFAFMPLPRIDITDVAAPGPGLTFTVPVREAGFCVDPGLFAQATGVPWERYVEEFGDEPVPVWIRSAVIRTTSGPARTADGGVREDVVFLLLDRRPGGGTRQRDPAARLFVQEGVAFPGLPESVRRQAEWPDEPGTRVLYARADLDLAPDRLGAAIYRPVARHLVRFLLTRLRAGEDAGHTMDAVLDEVGAPHERGRLGSLFTYVLAELEREHAWDEVFDAVDATGRFALRARLLQHCAVTPYARHARVQRLRAALAAERAATSAHAYVPGGKGQGAILLDHQEGKRVTAGEVLAKGDGIYSRQVPGLRPRPGKAEALREHLLKERHRLAEEILTGRDTEVYDAKTFSVTALARATKAAGLTEDDFEKVDVTYTIRLLDVIPGERDGLPSRDIRFEIVSRTAGSGEDWQRSAGPIVEHFGEFETRLVEWGMLRSGEALQVVNLIVVGAGAIVVGWSVGIVGILIQLGGGVGPIVTSIALSEAIYLLKVVLGSEHASLEGFALAAVEGYLGAVGFRFGSGLGGLTGPLATRRLGSELAGKVAQKLTTGAVTGASTAALDLFARDLVDVTLHGGGGHETQAYVEGMGWGALVGLFFSFVGEPLLKGAYQAVATRLGPTVAKAAIVAQLFAGQGVTAEQWAVASATGQQRMEQTLAGTLREAEAGAWSTAVGRRVDEVGEELARLRPAGSPAAPEAGATAGTSKPAAAAPKPAAAPGASKPAPGAHTGAPHGTDPHASETPVPPGTPPPAEPPTPSQPRPVRAPGPKPRWKSRKELEEAARTDPEAGQDLSWYENASYEQLRAREPGDPVAKEFLDAMRGGKRRTMVPDRPSDPDVQARLREDLREAREAAEARRRYLEQQGRPPGQREPGGWEEKRRAAGTQSVPPTAKSAAGYEGTVGVARTDIPALAGRRFTGGSPRAFGTYDPAHPIRPPENVVVPQAHGHAEQDLAQQLDTALAGLTDAERAAARGRTVSIRIDQEVCSTCATGLGGSSRVGVLAGLSRRHPEIVFEVTADDTSTVYRLLAGRRVR
ncbi:hypothetical protein [Streptomyces sp. WAC01280]|uniref:hypothetical protein n=1 Tax=Streptomyces sp. WAC01280 TaxID=2487424 RepID=UPI000F7A1924|nr:hypothetical protein [Streptomyces sp. WAC01280]RSS58832.1 hypothetical protein EF909_02475 [Streptomyces sp. WAC01280]